jgi:two-component system nitrate/nitrite response regulator NarL
MAIRIVIADDHPIVLDGLEQLFKLEGDFKVVGRCMDGEQTLRAVHETMPDLLIVDIRMPKRDGLSVIRELLREKIAVRVVLLTAALDEEEVIEAIRLGVSGVVLKDMAPQLLIQCIREVHAGRRWIDRETMSRAFEKVLRHQTGPEAPPLTPREIEIVSMVATGLRNKDIANLLAITEGTVKIHLHSIYEKLQVNGRLELSVYAREHGLLRG